MNRNTVTASEPSTPVYPLLFAAVLAGALHARGDHATAIAIAKDSLRLNQQDGHARVILCSALTASARAAEAKSIAVDLQRMEPDFEVRSFLERLPFRNPEMRAQLSESYASAIESAV